MEAPSSVELMPLNTESIASPSSITESITANATSPIRMAYSARSCPESSVQMLSRFMVVTTLLCAGRSLDVFLHPRAKRFLGDTRYGILRAVFSKCPCFCHWNPAGGPVRRGTDAVPALDIRLVWRFVVLLCLKFSIFALFNFSAIAVRLFFILSQYWMLRLPGIPDSAVTSEHNKVFIWSLMQHPVCYECLEHLLFQDLTMGAE